MFKNLFTKKSSYYYQIEGDKFLMLDSEKSQIGFLLFLETSEVIVITHTEIFPVFSGKGHAVLLVEAMVKKARKDKKKIIPACPIAFKIFTQHEAFSDVRNQNTRLEALYRDEPVEDE